MKTCGSSHWLVSVTNLRQGTHPTTVEWNEHNHERWNEQTSGYGWWFRNPAYIMYRVLYIPGVGIRFFHQQHQVHKHVLFSSWRPGFVYWWFTLVRSKIMEFFLCITKMMARTHSKCIDLRSWTVRSWKMVVGRLSPLLLGPGQPLELQASLIITGGSYPLAFPNIAGWNIIPSFNRKYIHLQFRIRFPAGYVSWSRSVTLIKYIFLWSQNLRSWRLCKQNRMVLQRSFGNPYL